MGLTANQQALVDADRKAYYRISEGKEIEINGMTFEIVYNLVSRQSATCAKVQTMMLKVNGKRMSWAKAMALLA